MYQTKLCRYQTTHNNIMFMVPYKILLQTTHYDHGLEENSCVLGLRGTFLTIIAAKKNSHLAHHVKFIGASTLSMVVFQYCTTTVASSRCPCFAVLPFGYVRSYLKRHVTRWQLAHRHLMLLLYQISLLYKILYKRNLIMVHAIVSLHCFYSFLNNLNY